MPKQESTATTLIINLKKGGFRSYRFPGILEGFELDLRLNSILDEMHDGNISSPLKVVRKTSDGIYRIQEIKLIGIADLE